MASSITLPDFELPQNEDEDYNDEDYEDADGEYDVEGEDLDAEAEAMARRLGDQLLADIAKAQAEVAAASATIANVSQTPTTQAQAEAPPQPTSLQKKKEAALLTIKGILAFASKYTIVGQTMSLTQVPGSEGGNLLEVFNRCVSNSSLTKPLARGLIEIVLSLAKSDALFGSLRNSDAPAIQLDKGKRKRDQEDEGGRYPAVEYPQKRIAVSVPVDQPDLLGQIGEALRIISHALTSHVAPAQNQCIDPALVSSIQLPLHQIFLFAVTSAPRAGDGRMQALQELAGLVQMLGVLSGIHIGNPPQWHVPPGAAPAPPVPDIGTAVYPCLVPGCPKTFHRLYSLRTHQRLHTLEHRPYRCIQCPASFVRNHDLKRHALLHEKKAWRCAGCNKIFSRRDAIKRHKDHRSRTGGKNRAGEADAVDTACAYADIEEVEIDRVEGEEEISRRAKLWNGIAASSISNTMAEHMGPEEGEVDPAVIHQAQHMVLQIHGLLQAEVAKGLGTPATPASIPPPHVSQSTLASIIARAQHSALPSASENATDSTTVHRPPATDSAIQIDPPPVETTAPPADTQPSSTPPPLSLSWLSEEQTRLLEQAIAQASSAAQAQAEAEAALEEEDEEFDEDEDQDAEGEPEPVLETDGNET